MLNIQLLHASHELEARKKTEAKYENGLLKHLLSHQGLEDKVSVQLNSSCIVQFQETLITGGSFLYFHTISFWADETQTSILGTSLISDGEGMS